MIFIFHKTILNIYMSTSFLATNYKSYVLFLTVKITKNQRIIRNRSLSSG